MPSANTSNISTIKILRSYSNSQPITLEDGQLAYSFVSNTLYIGSNTGIKIVSAPAESVVSDQFARATANTANVRSISSYFHANGAFIRASAAFSAANTADVRSISSYFHANGAFIRANAAFSTANTADVRSISSYFHANAAFSAANTADVKAQAAFNVANTGLNDQFARTTANSASANTIIIQGIDVGQNNRMSIIEGTDLSQNVRLNFSNTRMSVIEGTDVSQNARMAIIEGTDLSQNVRLDFSNTRMNISDNVNLSQNVRLDFSNTRMAIIEGVDASQNVRLNFSNTAINSADVKAQAAFDVANTGFGNLDNFARTTANSALDTANSASANTIITQGVDAGQNTRMAISDNVNLSQNVRLNFSNTRMNILDNVNLSQNVRLNFSNTAINIVDVKAQAAFDTANTGFGNLDEYARTTANSASANTISQNTRINISDNINLSQNVRLDFSNNRMTISDNVNLSQNVRLDFSNTRMNILDNVNLSQNVRLNFSNTRMTIIEGVDAGQNTRITNIVNDQILVDEGQNIRLDFSNTAIDAVDIKAQAAFDVANTVTDGVDQFARDGVNTASVLAQASYDYANTVGAGAVSNVALTYSGSSSGTIPAANTLKPGEPSLNLNDGRMFIQLNNGKIVDISTTPTGNTYHVAMNGDDSFVGDTPSAAKRTIRAAVTIAQPGDSVVVHTGKYFENTPIIIPQNVQVQGAGERTCIIEPVNSANDIFWVCNNSYVTGFKFVNYTGSAVAFPATLIENGVAQGGSLNTITLNEAASGYDNYYNSMTVIITSGTGSGQIANVISYNATSKVATVDINWPAIPDTSSNYSLSIPLRTTPAPLTTRYTTYITGSPYIYNSSSITTTGTGIKIDGDLATGNKSIISAQFTQVNSGGKGIHILNDGYSQLVSIYAIFCDTGFLAESGGTASMGNCNVNFGNKGLVANGRGKLAMTATLANTSGEAVKNITLNNVTPNTALSVTANVPYSGLIMKLSQDAQEYWAVTEATPLSGGNTVVTFQTTIQNPILSGNTVYFYQQSQLRASGQTFEWSGAGTNINAIPRLGGIANTQSQTVVIGEGAVYATSTDQAGNFTVSDLTINQSTSTITGRTFSKSLFAEMTPYILALEG